jgi:hypothetical protein
LPHLPCIPAHTDWGTLLLGGVVVRTSTRLVGAALPSVRCLLRVEPQGPVHIQTARPWHRPPGSWGRGRAFEPCSMLLLSCVAPHSPNYNSWHSGLEGPGEELGEHGDETWYPSRRGNAVPDSVVAQVRALWADLTEKEHQDARPQEQRGPRPFCVANTLRVRGSMRSTVSNRRVAIYGQHTFCNGCQPAYRYVPDEH